MNRTTQARQNQISACLCQSTDTLNRFAINSQFVIGCRVMHQRNTQGYPTPDYRDGLYGSIVHIYRAVERKPVHDDGPISISSIAARKAESRARRATTAAATR